MMVKGQEDDYLPFEKCRVSFKMNYKKCLYWAESFDGLYHTKAIYEGVIFERDKIMVMINEKHGLLNCDLTEFAPVIYDDIHSIFFGDRLFWVFIKDGKAALFNAQGDAITKHLYDEISTDYIEGGLEYSSQYNTTYNNYYAPINHYFEVRLNKKSGIIDTAGTFIHPLENDEVKLIEHTSVYPKSKTLLWVLQNDNGLEIKSIDNQLLYQDSSSRYIELPQLLRSGVDPILIIKNGILGKSILLNTKTKKITKSYFEVEAYFDQYIIRAKQFQELGLIDYYDPELNLIYSSNSNEQLDRLSPLTLYHLSGSKPKTNKIIDSKGETIIAGDYSKFQFKWQDSASYIWASNGLSLEGSGDLYYYAYDVYNLEGELLNKCGLGLGPNDIKKLNFKTFFERENMHYSGTGYSIYRPLLFGIVDGKWGGFNGKGEIIVPFKYDNFYGEILDRKTSQSIGYHCDLNGKEGLVNAENEIIFPFEYDSIHFNWNYTGFNYFEKDGKGALIAYDKSVIMDDITAVFNGGFKYERKDYRQKSRIGIYLKGQIYGAPTKELFIVQSDSLYWFDQTDFKLCDTSILKFESSSINIGNYIVKTAGNVISISNDRAIFAFPNYYLDIKDSVGYAYSLEGEKIAEIKNFKQAGMSAEFLLIKTTKQKIGLRSKDGTKWILKPKYLRIIPTKIVNEFWVKTKDSIDSKTLHGEWILVNNRDKNMFGDTTFSYPPVKPGSAWGSSISFANGKYGIIGASNEITLPPIYEFIIPSSTPGIYFIKKETKWAMFSELGFISSLYDAVADAKSLPIFKGVTYVDNDTLLEIIQFENGNWKKIVKSSHVDSIMEFVDLVTPLDNILPATAEQRKNNVKLWKSIQYSTTYQSGLFRINNYYFLRDFNPLINNRKQFTKILYHYNQFPTYYDDKTRIVKADKFEKMDQWWIMNPDFISNSSPKPNISSPKQIVKKFLYSDDKFYSEFVETLNTKESNRHYNNFLISNPTVNIQFYDLFENRRLIDSVLYDYIENHVNIHQLYGSVCINFPNIYSVYMQHFSFTEAGVKLHQYTTRKEKDVFISYELMKPYLKPEILALGEW
ncbi:MAG: hypothetical protein GQ574_23845 [Crocinitomix sp.]|nr:hypothetical protein [Crocinitomix sp.]